MRRCATRYAGGAARTAARGCDAGRPRAGHTASRALSARSEPALHRAFAAHLFSPFPPVRLAFFRFSRSLCAASLFLSRSALAAAFRFSLSSRSAVFRFSRSLRSAALCSSRSAKRRRRASSARSRLLATAATSGENTAVSRGSTRRKSSRPVTSPAAKHAAQ